MLVSMAQLERQELLEHKVLQERLVLERRAQLVRLDHKVIQGEQLELLEQAVYRLTQWQLRLLSKE